MSSAESVADLRLAVSEAAANAIEAQVRSGMDERVRVRCDLADDESLSVALRQLALTEQQFAACFRWGGRNCVRPKRPALRTLSQNSISWSRRTRSTLMST